MGSTKRMILNTGVMYGKMFISIIISLYTSRIIIDALGAEDYGIYNVVGGVVTMIVFLNVSLAAATQRYLTFELGKKENSNVQKIFSSSAFAHIFLAIVVFLIIEVIGLWFFDRFINVPEDRMSAALFVFHISALALVFNIVLVPYRALINAYEHMAIIAIIDVLNLVLKLFGVIYLATTSYDKLKVMSLIFSSIAFFTMLNYIIVCRIRYKESKLSIPRDRKLIKELLSFATFSLFGSISIMARNQGFQILINVFFGALMNASFSVAMQVGKHVRSFSENIMAAVSPQLVKRFARQDYQSMLKLAYQSSKLAFSIMLLMSSPFLFDAEFILDLWLVDVPENAVLICKLVLIALMIEIMVQPIMTLMMASGKIKLYQIVIGSLSILNIPVSYLFLKLGYGFETVFIVNIIIAAIAFFARLLFARKFVKLDIGDFLKNVVLPILYVIIIVLLINYGMRFILSSETIAMSLTKIILSALISLIPIYLIGFSRAEKKVLREKLAERFLKKKNV